MQSSRCSKRRPDRGFELLHSTFVSQPAELLLTSKSESNRWQLIECLGEIGQGNQEAIEVLIEWLRTSKYKNTALRYLVCSIG